VAALIDGRARDATPLERALVALARKSWAEPARLAPVDLAPVRAVVGDGALDYVLVLGGFHFINRIADLLDVDPEALPESLRRFEPIRKLGVRIAAMLMARWDLANRPYGRSYEEACEAWAPVFAPALGHPLGDELAPLRARPKVIEAIALALEERDARSSLERASLAAVQRAVEQALPSREDEADGFHARPADPVEAFAFVGTRYAQRTTAEMIDALRARGFDDLGILDLAIAVADANQWARTHRLLGLAPELFYLPAGVGARTAVA